MCVWGEGEWVDGDGDEMWLYGSESRCVKVCGGLIIIEKMMIIVC